MKLCTIIYAGDPLVSLPQPTRLSEIKQIFQAHCIDSMTEGVEKFAINFGRNPNSLVWSDRIGTNPLSIQVACDDDFAESMRFYLNLTEPVMVEVDDHPAPKPATPRTPKP